MKPNPREKFIELAEKRVDRAIRDIRLIGNLSNRSNYSFTEQQVAKICKALRDEIKDCEQRFKREGQTKVEGFKL